MQYREVGDTGIMISTLGHGTMRYKGPENAAEMIHHGLSLGMNYFDIGPAYSYNEFDDNAESWVGRAIAGVPRENMVLSSKAQPRAGEPKVERSLGISTRDQMWQCIENSLKRAGVEYFDFYQLWDMSAPDHFETACIGPDTPLAAMREAKEQGLVKHLGFTTHNPLGDQVIDWLGQVPDFKFITVYYNFTDTAPEKVIDYAREHGVGVCIMGPLRGGLLVGESPAFERALPEFAGLPVQEIAIRFLLGNPGVTTLISGMNEIEHMDQNARVASLEDPMTPEQRERFIQAFRDFTKGEPLCTGCRYCAAACPEHLPVWMMMPMYQLAEVFEVPSARKMVAKMVGSERMDPSKCIACGVCVEKCPQNLPIPERMEKLVDLSNAFKAELGEE